MKDRAKTASISGRGRRWHAALVVCELALGLIPLTGAGLMLKSLWQVRAETDSSSPHEVLAGRLQPTTPEGNTASAGQLRNTDDALRQIEALPGVRAAAVWNMTFGLPAQVAGLPEPSDGLVAMWLAISPHHREAAGMRLLAGRWFSPADRANAAHVVVVSDSFARSFAPHLRPGESLVGRKTYGPFDPKARGPVTPMTIMGVTTDFRPGGIGALRPDDSTALPQVFFQDAARPIAGGYLIVRTVSRPLDVVGPVRAILAQRLRTDLVGARTLENQLATSVAPRTFHTTLMLAFGIATLVMAVVGAYGVLSYGVSQRRQEIGVRLALGARRTDVMRMVMSHGLKLATVGAALGLLGCLVLARSIASLLYGVTPMDLSTYTAAVLLLIAVSLIATYVPARRVMRVEPVVALRLE
jgi:putative ABC transport system permease protein